MRRWQFRRSRAFGIGCSLSCSAVVSALGALWPLDLATWHARSMRLLVFLHGTTIMHPGGVGWSRAERVVQARSASDPRLRDYAAYVPIDDAVAKVRRWFEQGAEIVYLSSHRDSGDVIKDEAVLERYGFPPGRVVARRGAETYGDVAVREMPDVLIEDDCESMGGDDEVTYRQIPPEVAARITSIVVPEFGGIGHLPDRVDALPGFVGR